MVDKNIDMCIDDALIEKPYPFSVEVEGKCNRHFFLYPVTLGKLHILKRHMDNLDIDIKNVEIAPHLEALRVVSAHKEETCKVLAYHTLKRKRDIFDIHLVQEIAEFFKDNVTDEELATLLIIVLTKDNIQQYKERLGITKENDRLKRVIQAKNAAQSSKNDFEFGGKTIYGTLIDQACERYGWEYDYVMWGISLINLQLLMADKIQNIYLTDDEKKKISSSLLNNDRDVIKADDKANKEKILSMDWK